MDVNQILESMDINDNMTLRSGYFNYNLNLRRFGFEDEKEEKKFIKKMKQTVRSSFEYQDWRDYIKDILNNNECQLSGENANEVTIEMHHHPLALENIIDLIVMKKLQNNEGFTTFEICQEVMEYHYSNKIGFIPLTTTLHEKFHNGFLDLPINFCQGYWELFWDEHKQYQPEHLVTLVNKYCSITELKEYTYINPSNKDKSNNNIQNNEIMQSIGSVNTNNEDISNIHSLNVETEQINPQPNIFQQYLNLNQNSL